MWEWVDGRCPIRAITNAVNLHYWQDPRMGGTKTDEELLSAKYEMKQELQIPQAKDLTQMFLQLLGQDVLLITNVPG